MAAYDDATALLVVDVQNDFADPAGSLYVRDGDRVVADANGEIARALAAGAAVVRTQDWHPETTPHFAKDGGIWPTHCVRETWGAELHPDLTVEGEVVRKGTGGEDGYSGFSVRDPRTGDVRATELEAILRGRGVERLVVCGLATDYCVAETVLDGRRLGFAVTVLEPAIRAVDLEPGDGERAIARMRDAGADVVSAFG
jgi:nicotinamidase/pyrazinamidase